MYKLLDAGFERIKKNKVFFGCIIATIGIVIFMIIFPKFSQKKTAFNKSGLFLILLYHILHNLSSFSFSLKL